jgi:epoxyqueuosine reductase
MSQITNNIKERASALGFDDCGIAAADGQLPYKEYLAQAAEEGRFGPLDYLHKSLEARINLHSVFPEAKSVVVLVKNYYTGDHEPKKEKQGKIARYAWGKDYHHWFKKRLRALVKPLKEEANAQVWTFNDTGPFLERAWAFKAGLGFIGKSAMFIHRKMGTWTFLGGFATDLVLKADEAYRGPDCGSCTRCMNACPSQAILSPRKVDARKCISTWTIERSRHPEVEELAPRNHDWVFGCDVCQEVCPWNKFQQITQEERFQPLPERVYFSEATLAQDLRGSPLYRSGHEGLKANFLRFKKSLHEKNQRHDQSILPSNPSFQD